MTREEAKKIFNERFEEVSRQVSDTICDIIWGRDKIWKFHVFDGWEDVFRLAVMPEEAEPSDEYWDLDFGYANEEFLWADQGNLVNGQKLFISDDGDHYHVIDADVLKKLIVKEIDAFSRL